MEEADFLKFRELSLTFFAPQNWARLFRSRGMSITLAGRNLGTITDYTGMDPETNFAGGANFNAIEFLTQPPVRYFTARVNLSY